MSKLVVHKSRVVDLGKGCTRTTTLCGFVGLTDDGMNIADKDKEVTCKFCLRRMYGSIRGIPKGE